MEAVPKAKELIEESSEAFFSEQYDDAYSLARRALAAQKEGCPNHRCGHVAMILLHMGSTLAAMGRYDEALKLLTESIEIAKEVEAGGCGEMREVRADALIQRAETLRSTERQPREALLATREAVAYAVSAFGEKSTKHAQALLTLSTSLYVTGDPVRALDVADKALAVLGRTNGADNDEVMRNVTQVRLVCLGTLGRTEEAEAARASLVSRGGSDISTTLFEARSLVAAGKHAEARDVLLAELESARTQLGDRHPTVNTLATWLTKVCHDCERWEEAAEYGRLLFHKSKTADSLVLERVFPEFLAALLKLGREEEAHAHVKKAPRWAELGHTVPPQLLALGSADRPATDLYGALEVEMAYPAEVRDAVDRAEEMIRAKQFEAAARVLTGALGAARAGNTPARVTGQVVMKRAQARYAACDFDAAIADAEEAERLAPGSGAWEVANSACAVALEKRGSRKEAAVAYKELGSRIFRFRPWEPERALQYYDMAVKCDPQLASAHSNRGVMLSRIPARKGEARAAFRRALELAEAQGDAALAAKARKKLRL